MKTRDRESKRRRKRWLFCCCFIIDCWRERERESEIRPSSWVEIFIAICFCQSNQIFLFIYEPSREKGRWMLLLAISGGFWRVACVVCCCNGNSTNGWAREEDPTARGRTRAPEARNVQTQTLRCETRPPSPEVTLRLSAAFQTGRSAEEAERCTGCVEERLVFF